MIYRILIRNSLNKHLLNVCNGCVERIILNKLACFRTIYSHRSFEDKPQKRSKNPELFSSIKDSDLAKTVAKYVTTDLPSNCFIFELCPGSGLLTEQLLKSRVQSVRVFEDNPEFIKQLSSLQNQYPNRLQIIDKQIINFHRFFSKYSNLSETEIDYWFKDIPRSDWRSESSVRFVAILSPKSVRFVRLLLRSVMTKDLFFAYGRTQLFLFVSETEYTYMTAQPTFGFKKYRSVTVLYNSFFDIQTLETVPYSVFEVNSNTQNKNRKNSTLKGNAVLVRLIPKQDLDKYSVETIKEYHHFVTQTFMKPTNFIIPFLETWFPNCGPDLIEKGIPVFKYFGDLTPEEMFDLFLYLKDRADYEKSLYKSISMPEDYDLFEADIKAIDNEIDLKDNLEINEN